MFGALLQEAVGIPQPPLDWTAIIVQAMVSLAAVLAVALPAYLTLKGKISRTETNSDIIKDETRNAHSPDRPLRHDIDTLLERTERMDRNQREIQKDVGGLRGDVRQLYRNDHDLWDTLSNKKDRGGSSE